MNNVTIKSNKIIKQFSSHADFTREVKVYEKLKGSGLAPELEYAADGEILVKPVSGEVLSDILPDSLKDTDRMNALISAFLDWYVSYREITHLGLGEMDPGDFIYADSGKIVGYDFEHTSPCFPEEDIARMAAFICLANNAYSSYGMENAKAFINSAKERIKLGSSKLCECLKIAFPAACEELGVEAMSAADNYVISSVCTDIVLDMHPGLVSIVGALQKSQSVWVAITTMATSPDREKILRYVFSAEKENVGCLYLTEGGKPKTAVILINKELALDALQKSIDNGIKHPWDALIIETHSRAIAIEDMKGYEKGII